MILFLFSDDTIGIKNAIVRINLPLLSTRWKSPGAGQVVVVPIFGVIATFVGYHTRKRVY